MLSTFSCWAFIPLAALYKARIICQTPFRCLIRVASRANAGYFLNCLRVHVTTDANGLLQHFELAHNAHETHSSARYSYVRAFQLALLDTGIGHRLRNLGGVGVLEVGASHLL